MMPHALHYLDLTFAGWLNHHQGDLTSINTKRFETLIYPLAPTQNEARSAMMHR